MDKKLFRNGPYADFFSQGVQMGNILTLAGQLGDDLEGNVPKDLQGQMENCYRNIENIFDICHYSPLIADIRPAILLFKNSRDV